MLWKFPFVYFTHLTFNRRLRLCRRHRLSLFSLLQFMKMGNDGNYNNVVFVVRAVLQLLENLYFTIF